MSYSYNSWQGSDLAWNLIFESYSDARYELLGPEGYDKEYRDYLKESGEWEEELASWEEPSEEEAAALRVKHDTLLEAMKLCRQASERCKRSNADSMAEFDRKNRSYY